MVNLEFGITEDTRLRPDEDGKIPKMSDLYDERLREIVLAEQLGFKYYFVLEHQGNDGACTSPLIYLAGLAAHTSKIKLGTMVITLPFHNPVRLAQDVAMLDHLSKGRVELGVGSGVLEHEFARWDLPFSDRRQMGAEALEIIKKAWTQDIVSHDGNYWKFHEALPWPQPYQKPYPPLWFGAFSNFSYEFTARENYDLAMWGDPDEKIAEKISNYCRVWDESGHSGPMPRRLLDRTVYVAETDEQAYEEASEYIIHTSQQGQKVEGNPRVMRTKIGWKGNPGTGSYADLNQTFGGMATNIDFWIDNGLAHVGSPETVIGRLEAQQKLLGHDIFSARFKFGGLPNDLVDKSIRLFGEKVLPAFSKQPLRT